MTHFGKSLRAARLRVGMTQQVAAFKAGYAQQSVWSALERQQNVTMRTVERCAKALGVPSSELIAERGEPPEGGSNKTLRGNVNRQEMKNA